MVDGIFSLIARRSVGVSLSICVLAALVAVGCDGTSLPDSGGGGSTETTSLPTKSVTLRVTVNGDEGQSTTGSSSAPLSSKKGLGRGTGKKFDAKLVEGLGGEGLGANGNDIVDLSGNNLVTSGLATNDIPAIVRYYAEGDGTLLGSTDVDGNAMETEVGGTSLGAGQGLVVEVESNGVSSRATIPSSYFKDGTTLGLNIYRRTDGSLVLELFPDKYVPYGRSDNGTRVVMDTTVDFDRDGDFETVSRLETPDGLVLWDSNLDGAFGSTEDAVQLFDSNRDGQIDSADTPVSLAIDVNLDGMQEDDEDRLVGNHIPEDFINGVSLAAAPQSVVGNGLSNFTLIADIDPAFEGSPIGAVINLLTEVQSGAIQPGSAGPRFLGNGRDSIKRTLTPTDPTVRVSADGSIRVLEAVRAPIMQEAGSLRQTLSYRTSTIEEPRFISIDVDVTPNDAPVLVQVNFAGTAGVPPNASGLEAASTSARMVYGNPVQIVGRNFATDVEELTVNFGGIQAEVEGVSDDGTVIFTRVPNGATRGPISVLQGGVGVSTSQDFVVAGSPLSIIGRTPEIAATGINRDALLSIRFNQPVSPASVRDGFRLRAAGNPPQLVVGTPVISEDGVTLTFLAAEALAADTQFEAIITGSLRASNNVRFDRDPFNAILPIDEGDVQVLSFTTSADLSVDMTPPIVDDAQTTFNAPATANGNWNFDIVFNERVDGATVYASQEAMASDSVRLQRVSDGSYLNLALSTNLAGDAIHVEVMDDVYGLEDYRILISTDVSDASGNALGAEYSRIFSTSLIVNGVSQISGAPGDEIAIYGSSFDASPNVTVEFVNATATPTQVTKTEIIVVVPEGASDGLMRVLVGTNAADAVQNFVITSTGIVRRDVATGAGAFGVATTADGRALVSYQGQGELAVIDLGQQAAIDTDPDTTELDNITVTGVPTEALLDLTGRIGFTTNYGTADTPGQSIFLVDMETYTLLASVRVGQRPTRMAISPNNRYLYVTNFLDNSVSKVNVASYEVESTLATGLGPNGVAIAPNNLRGYVCNYLEGTVTVFETGTFAVTGIIQVGERPARATLSRDSRTLFVTNNGSGSISVVDTETLAVRQTIRGFSSPSAMAQSSDGNTIWVTNRGSNTVQQVVFDETDMRWTLGTIRIATPAIPAGVAISKDSSTLVITSEGGGIVSLVRIGDPQPVISGLALDDEGEVGGETFSCDPREQVWITGQGFGSTAADVSVTLNGENIVFDSASFSSRGLAVTIPLGAQSGPLVVSRMVDGEPRSSNEYVLTVTPKTPQVIRMVPGDGSQDVEADTYVVVEFNEPLDESTLFTSSGQVREVQGVPVARVVRLSDAGGNPELIRGNWVMGPFGTKITYSLAEESSLLKGESNNRYEVVVSPTVKDLFGNSVTASPTSFASANDPESGGSSTLGTNASSLGFRGRFQTQDLLGPNITAAYYRDVDNNGVNEGDELELFFNEELFLREEQFDLVNALVAGGAGGVFADNGTPLLARRGSSIRSIICTLGQDAVLSFGTAATTIEVVDQQITAFNDFAGNRPVSGAAVPIQVDPTRENRDNPRIIAASWIDLNTSSSVDDGDELHLIFSEPMLIGANGVNGPASMINLSGGASLGASAFGQRISGNYRTVIVSLSGATGITPGATTLTLIGTGTPAKMDGADLTDFLSNPAYAETYGTVTISDGIPGSAVLDAAVKPTHYDVHNTVTGLSQGDAIVVSFTNPVTVNSFARDGGSLRPSDVFALGVNGDRFGSGARLTQPMSIFVADGTQNGSELIIAPNQVVIILGRDPVLTAKGDFGVDIVTTSN